MIPCVNIITLGVADLKRSELFYAQGLGFPQMAFEGDICFFTLKGSWLALHPRQALAQDACVPASGSGFSGITLAHVVDSESAVLACLDEAVCAGGRLLKPAKKAEWGGFSGYFSDPDDHVWEVAYNPFFWPGPKQD